jgi:hypothetical protein
MPGGQNYLKLYEDTLHDWLSTEKVDQAEFYRMVQQVLSFARARVDLEV